MRLSSGYIPSKSFRKYAASSLSFRIKTWWPGVCSAKAIAEILLEEPTCPFQWMCEFGRLSTFAV